jgi:hypothetical protein
MVIFSAIRVAETWTPLSVIGGLALVVVVAATIAWLVYRS